MGWAQVSAPTLDRDEALRNQVDDGSPQQGRIPESNGVDAQLDAWYTAFHVQPTTSCIWA